MTPDSAFPILGVAVALALLVYALLPLLRAERRGRRPRDVLAVADEDRLLDEREAALRALAEVEFDHQLGNLDDAEYRDLRERYRHRAVAVLRALDGHEPALDEQIEQAVALHRVARREESGRMALAQRAITQPRVPRRLGGHDLPSPAPSAARGRPATWVAFVLGAAFLFAGAVLTLYLVLNRGDGGHTALAVISAPPPLEIAAGPRSGLLLGSAEGLRSSADSGHTWEAVPGVSGGVLALLGSTDGQAPLVAATSAGIYRGADGASWQHVGDIPSGQLLALARGAQPASLYAAAADGHLFASGDGGATWRTLKSAPVPVTTLAILPGAPDLLLVGTDGQGVLASGDGGSTWAAANGFANGLLASTRVRALLFDPGSGESAAAPNGRTFSGTLYAGTDAGLARSLDGGASWSRLPFRGDVRALGAGAGSPAPLYLLDAQGRLYRSADRGLTW